MLPCQGVALLERGLEVWPCWMKYATGDGLWVSNVQVEPSVSPFLLPAEPDVELSAPPSTMSACVPHHTPRHDDNKVNL